MFFANRSIALGHTKYISNVSQDGIYLLEVECSINYMCSTLMSSCLFVTCEYNKFKDIKMYSLKSILTNLNECLAQSIHLFLYLSRLGL